MDPSRIRPASDSQTQSPRLRNGYTFLVLALGLRYRGTGVKSCLAPQGSLGQLFLLKATGRWLPGSCEPTGYLCKGLWVKPSLPDLGRGVMLKAVLALVSQG